MSETGSVGIGNEPSMHAALPFCSAIDKRWNKKEVSRLSPVAAEMRLPSSCKDLHRILAPHARHLACQWSKDVIPCQLLILCNFEHGCPFSGSSCADRCEGQIRCRKCIGHRNIPCNVSATTPWNNRGTVWSLIGSMAIFAFECKTEACWFFLGLNLSSIERAPDRIIKEAMSNLFAIPLSTSEALLLLLLLLC